MYGLISKYDVLSHPLLMVNSFGVKSFFKVLFASDKRSFIDIINENNPHPKTTEQTKKLDLIDRLIAIEIKVSQIYKQLGVIFKEHSDAKKFFKALFAQELDHAAILKIAKIEISFRNLWNLIDLLPVRSLEKTEKEIQKIETSLNKPKRIKYLKGLEIVKKVEKAETKAVCHAVSRCCKSPFLKRVSRLIPLIADHHLYINSSLPSLQGNYWQKHLLKEQADKKKK